MKFGKVQNLDNIDFSLPELKFYKVNKKYPPQIYIGGPLWGCKDWIGKIYPVKTKSSDFLSVYSTQYNSIELNSTYYKSPEVSLVKDWKSKVSKEFKFFPKIPSKISHYGGLSSKTDIFDFCDSIKFFEENLGTCFLQLHESFSIQRLDKVKEFIDIFPDSISLAIEFRNKDWFLENNVFWNILKDRNVTSIITDTAGKREVLHGNVTTNDLFVRFTGNDLHKTDFDRLDQWTEILSKEILNLSNIYFFIHEPNDIYFPEASYHFIKSLKKALTNLTITEPKLYNNVDQLQLI